MLLSSPPPLLLGLLWMCFDGYCSIFVKRKWKVVLTFCLRKQGIKEHAAACQNEWCKVRHVIDFLIHVINCYSLISIIEENKLWNHWLSFLCLRSNKHQQPNTIKATKIIKIRFCFWVPFSPPQTKTISLYSGHCDLLCELLQDGFVRFHFKLLSKNGTEEQVEGIICS